MSMLKCYKIIFVLFLSIIFSKNSTAQIGVDEIYVSPTGTLYTFPASEMGIFGNLINDAIGGVNHVNGGDVYFYNHTTGITEIKDGPLSTAPTDNYNAGGSFVRFYNLLTDNTALSALPSGTYVNKDSGTGDINIRQEARISNMHTFVNGTIWTPRSQWRHAYLHYDTDLADYTGNVPNNGTAAIGSRNFVDGYVAKTGSSTFMFPISDGIYSRFCGISNPSLGTFKAAYFAKNAPDSSTAGISGNPALPDVAPNMINGLVKVNHTEFWDIDGTANSNYIITALNSVPGYSDWAVAANFLGLDPTQITVTGFDIWEDLGIATPPTALSNDGIFTSTSPVTPDVNYSAFTWANKNLILIQPDINVTSIYVQIAGSVKTNDIVNPGTLYSNPMISGTNPNATLPMLNSDGTYTFMSGLPGQYTFLIDVCLPGMLINCPKEYLTITVLDTILANNNAVVNTDIGNTMINTPVTLNSLANDQSANNPNNWLLPRTVVITTNPMHGTAVVDTLTGAITYTPDFNFTGQDTLYYQVCNNAIPAKCGIGMQIISINALGSANTTSASDDYASTGKNSSVYGNVKKNDIDAEGNGQAVVPQVSTVAGKGTLTLLANGNYTFTPATNYMGPVSFVYTTCDSGTPPICVNATLYILVKPGKAFPLGLEFSSFTAQAKGCASLLTWITLKEEFGSYFSIQRKDKDDTAFVEIAKVAAVGTTSGYTQYTYLDEKVTEGNYLYQIVFVGTNGKESTTEVESVRINCDNEPSIYVYPNPATDNIYINITNGRQTMYTVRIIDMLGQIAYVDHVKVDNKNQIIKVPSQQLANANYILELSNDIERKMFKIIKK
jgi:Bacterial Ig domain/Secretion system C-terminal sorting domain